MLNSNHQVRTLKPGPIAIPGRINFTSWINFASWINFESDAMGVTIKACRQAMMTAFTNGILALALMLLVEFAISGTLRVTEPYLWAGLLVWLVIFSAQFYRQLRLCRCSEQRRLTSTPASSGPSVDAK